MAFRKVQKSSSGVGENILGAGMGFLGGAVDTMSEQLSGNAFLRAAEEEEELNAALESLGDEELAQLGVDRQQLQQRPQYGALSDVLNEATGNQMINAGQSLGHTAGEMTSLMGMPMGQLAGAAGFQGAGEFLGMQTPELAQAAKSGLKFGAGSEAGKQMGLGPVGQTLLGAGADIGPSALREIGSRAGRAFRKVGEAGKEATAEMAQKAEQQALRQSEIDVMKQEIADAKAQKREMQFGQKDAQREINTLSENAIQQYETMYAENALGELEALEGKTVEQIEKSLIDDVKQQKLNEIAPVETVKDSMEKVKQGINHQYQEAREAYGKLYDEVQAVTDEAIFTKVEQAKNRLRMKNHELPRLKSDPAEKEAIRVKLDQVYQDLTKPDLKIGDMINIKRNLADFVNYESLIPKTKNTLKPLIAEFDGLINEELGKVSSEALKTNQRANQLYKNAADIYANDHILSIRKSLAPEKTMNQNAIGSNASLVKQALQGHPASQYFEAELLRMLSKQSASAGKDTLRELAPFLSDESKSVAQDILKMGDRFKIAGTQSEALQTVLKESQNMATLGERPSSTLKMMDSPKGKQFIESTLKRSPKGKEILNHLYNQKSADLMGAIFKDNKVNLPKLNNILKDKNYADILSKAYGPQSVKWLRNLNGNMKRLDRNLSNLSNLQESIDRLVFDQEQSARRMGADVGSTFGENIIGNISENYSPSVAETAVSTVLPVIGAFLPKKLQILGGVGYALKNMSPEFINMMGLVLKNKEMQGAFNELFNPKSYLTSEIFSDRIAKIAVLYNSEAKNQ